MTGTTPFSMTGPAPINTPVPAPLNRVYIDKRVAVPLVPRTAVMPSKPRSDAVQMPALARHAASRGSPLNHVAFQGDDRSHSPIKKCTPMEMLNRDSEADDDRYTQGPIGTRSSTVSYARPSFSTDTGPNVKWIGAHYVCIGGIKITELEETQDLLDARFDWGRKVLSQRAVYATSNKDTLKMYLCFDGMDDAAAAADQLTAAVPGWECDYVPFHEYADAEAGSPGDASFYDGQVVFVGTFVGQISQLGTSNVYDQLLTTIQDFGEVLAISEIAQTSTSLEFRVEYNKISCARAAISKLRPEAPQEQNGWKIHAKEMLDRGKEKLSLPASLPALLQQEDHLDGAVVHSPSGRTAWSCNAYGHLKIEEATQATPTAMVPQHFPQQFAPHGPRFGNFDGGFSEPPEHYGRPAQPYQHVLGYNSKSDIDLEEIRNGRDVRTTIMLRNIPNSWTYIDLKNRLDEFIHGRYDFSYLRIDFQKHKNVGYGFINVLDAMDIIPLYQALFDQAWARRGNLKRKCTMSYATVQGIECLIEKFRNSAIMAEFPAYTAKTWWTWDDVNDTESNSQSSSYNSGQQQLVASHNGSATYVTRSMVGTERPFPCPDNMSKFQRSNANASQSELWAGPRGRGGFSYGGHRGGYSSWDRGTTRQMNEDFFSGLPVQGMALRYPVFLPQQMMGQYLQQQNGSGYGDDSNNHANNQVGFHINDHSNSNSNYQHHGGAGNTNARQYGGHHGRGGAGGGFVSNDARNDIRIPRSFSFDNLQAAQQNRSSNRGGFHQLNQRGGRIYS